MFTIVSPSSITHTSKRSKFHCFIEAIHNEDELKFLLKQMRKKHPKAAHVCYAARYQHKNNIREKFSDNGEPNGTAGLPILNALKSKDLINTVSIVVRYFGGILLGKSGLIHSYKQATLNAIEDASYISVQNMVQKTISIPFDQFEQWKYNLHKVGGNITKLSFFNAVEVEYEIPV
jgi:uncharacterized YigZ family protein